MRDNSYRPKYSTDYILILKQLGLQGAVHDYIKLSSAALGKMLDISQQSASRKILALLEANLITRTLTARSQYIKLTPKGIALLRKEFADYQRILDSYHKLTIHGKVICGMGEGRYYVTEESYMSQFREKLKFTPYRGTLNLKVSPMELHKLEILKDADGIQIHGFKRADRTFGGCKCFLAKIMSYSGAVIMPIRTHYTDVIEVISKYYLRGKLKLNDGDTVKLEIQI
jgi:riboflavin kinase